MIDIKAMAVEAGFCEAWVEAGANPPNHPAPVELLEKFAQAVARECADIASDTIEHGGVLGHHSANAIKARFGLEG